MPQCRHIRAAIIGGSQCGKTFLASGYVRGFWAGYRMRSIVFDPWRGETDWGPGAWVTKDFEQWKRVVLSTRGCAAVWDEVTTHGGDDDANTPLFTEIRHRHRALLAMGHAYDSVLRIMRVNLTDLCLSLSDDYDAANWARAMKCPALKDAKREDLLKQYYFMHKAPYRPVRILTYSKAEIQAGIYF